MNKIFPHIHTKKVLFVLNYCSKIYNHVVKRNLPLTENLLPRVWLYSTAYLGVSQSLDSIAQRKRTADRRCKLLQRPPFISISSLTPIRGPLVTAVISGCPAPLLDTLTTAAGWRVITLCFPHGHHHTARWRPRQDSLKPLGPQYSFCCFTLPVLGPGTISLSHGSLVGRTMQMDALFHLFLC